MLAPVASLLVALAVAQPAAVPPSALDAPDAPREVYRLYPVADATALGVSTVVLVVPALFASQIIHPSCPCSTAEINGFDRWTVGFHSDSADLASSITVGLAMVAPPVLDLLDVGWGRAFGEDFVVFAETLMIDGAINQAVKYAVQRPLPRTYAGDPNLVPNASGYRSFYSGHTSLTFSALTAAAFTLRARHGEMVWPWVAAGAIGASVAVERVAAGRHFPSDVLVGAGAGIAVGLAVPWLHLRREQAGVTIAPAPGGVALLGRF